MDPQYLINRKHPIQPLYSTKDEVIGFVKKNLSGPLFKPDVEVQSKTLYELHRKHLENKVKRTQEVVNRTDPEIALQQAKTKLAQHKKQMNVYEELDFAPKLKPEQITGKTKTSRVKKRDDTSSSTLDQKSPSGPLSATNCEIESESTLGINFDTQKPNLNFNGTDQLVEHQSNEISRYLGVEKNQLPNKICRSISYLPKNSPENGIVSINPNPQSNYFISNVSGYGIVFMISSTITLFFIKILEFFKFIKFKK